MIQKSQQQDTDRTGDRLVREALEPLIESREVDMVLWTGTKEEPCRGRGTARSK
jgi:hypothetical protein